MTNYNERLDEIFAPLIDSPSLTLTTAYWDQAKQAITSLIKELVKEAKPEKKSTEDYGSWEEGHRNAGWNNCLEQFEQNLLKALSKE